MSEILRAVLDQTCTFSSPVFYTLTFPTDTNNQFHFIKGFLQCKPDSYFLMTGFALFKGTVFAGVATTQVAQQSREDVFNPQNDHHLFFGTDEPGTVGSPPLGFRNFVYANLINDKLNQFCTMPEYVLWEPQQTIGAQIFAQGVSGGNSFQYWMTLMGIEYKK